MKAYMKTIAIGAALAAMAVGTFATVSVYAAEKQPGESGYGYVNEFGKHPGESGYNYSAPDTDVNANGKHPGESGYNYSAPDTDVNANGKHPGESGYNYAALFAAMPR